MGLQIEDGSGKGYNAKVNDENRLLTSCITEPLITHVADEYAKSFTWTHSYDYDADDTILLVSNNNTNENLYIHYISIASDTSTQYYLHSPEYPTLAGTEITGVNTNRTSGVAAEVEAYGDETGNTRANVLASGIVMANTTMVLPAEGSIVLGYRNCIAVDLVSYRTSHPYDACRLRESSSWPHPVFGHAPPVLRHGRQGLKMFIRKWLPIRVPLRSMVVAQ